MQRKGDLSGGGLKKVITIVIALAIIALIGVAVMNIMGAGDTKIKDTELSYMNAAKCEAQCALCTKAPCYCELDSKEIECA
ncbi:MAG: hypothetical protein KAI53_00085 [Candidatus Aenigmarchaeota archaeon]|nr:hypothetical protein [Candidatus Aenigmarchaeota archaeon]